MRWIFVLEAFFLVSQGSSFLIARNVIIDPQRLESDCGRLPSRMHDPFFFLGKAGLHKSSTQIPVMSSSDEREAEAGIENSIAISDNHKAGTATKQPGIFRRLYKRFLRPQRQRQDELSSTANALRQDSEKDLKNLIDRIEQGQNRKVC